MSAFSGQQPKGAKRIRQQLKRTQAEERNARTPESRRRQARRAAERLT